MRNDPKKAIEDATFKAILKVIELRKIWMEEYPDCVDQTLYNIVMEQLDILLSLIRLSAKVEE